MKLDFSLLTKPTQRFGGQAGQGGQAISMLVPASPELSPVDLEKGDKLPKAATGVSICPPLSPNCPPKLEGRISSIDAIVPHVPLCPPRKAERPHCMEELEEFALETPLADVELETACRCSKRPVPHLHCREDRGRAIREWNRDSKWRIQ